MPVIQNPPTSGPAGGYCTLADLRGFGLTVAQASDDVANAAILDASRVIDEYTQSQFYVSVETLVINDVRLPLVCSPITPIQNLTAVLINGQALGANAYTLEPWGVRLYLPGVIDADGYPRKPYTSTYERSLGVRFGQSVSLTGSFGYATLPLTVTRACKILSARFALEGVSNLLPDSRVKTVSVEGYSRSFDHRFGDTLESTGDLAVDRLLVRYLKTQVQVG